MTPSELAASESVLPIPQTTARALESFGDFEIVSKLGQGGMGAVYRARQITLDRLVALKILPTHFEQDADYVGRFQREAKVAASLNHPNLVRVYAFGVSDGCHYIAMELVEGENLHQRLRRGALPMPEALRICLDVAHGLQCGWQLAQLIHRDIKPSNIYLSQSGEVKLGDLGLAKSLTANTTGLTQTGTMMGTPHYMSPEQVRGDKTIDHRADIYSLGCTLFEMLTGQPPYPGSDPISIAHQQINAPLPALLKVLPGCPIPLARLVGRMLKKQARERPPHYEELIAEMERVREVIEHGDPSGAAAALVAGWRELNEGARPAPAASPAAPAPGGKSKLPVWLAAAMGVIVLGVLAFVLMKPAKPRKAGTAVPSRPPAAAGKPPDGPLATAVPTSLATKDAPFVNTLGMKFVPVPITGGPTGGQRVLFSVWETRVQDYEVFATETKRVRSKPPFEQGPTHPAVLVSWDDAQAFCAWLTEREQKAGRIGTTERYRLPFDHEWSCAIGLGDREDSTKMPQEKAAKIADVFSWGSTWPPPPRVGNFSGEEAASHEIAPTQKILSGYRDDFPWTAPVGSFTVSAVGLFDLAGNVEELCEDWYDSQHKIRVSRGSSLFNGTRSPLLASSRGGTPSVGRTSNLGFRCVLGISEPPAAIAAAQGASPTPADATKDAPFVNGLGMKFVPVPITGGATGGQRVLFSVWETRVQDYEVFVKETGVKWEKTSFQQGPTHPAANVTWHDAQAFCAWLTEHERKAGRLGSTERYRLPSDHEWSCAVGIGAREDPAKTPEEKHQKIADLFPWGTIWPPPPGAGNYSGEEAAGHEISKGQERLAGYRDDFPETAPVGSFAANGFGLFDLGGNVWEWCEDIFKPSEAARVMRGASFMHWDLGHLRSSARFSWVPELVSRVGGFRVVLAPAPAAR
jgi:formylglycine-generating enzyme required for sulfatase activity